MMRANRRLPSKSSYKLNCLACCRYSDARQDNAGLDGGTFRLSLIVLLIVLLSSCLQRPKYHFLEFS